MSGDSNIRWMENQTPPWAPARRIRRPIGGKVDPDDIFANLDAPQWMEEGLCAQTDPESFFPEKGGSTKLAKAVCVGCPVKTECLEFALEHDERYGIWGGLSERERRVLKRQRKTTA